MAKKRGSQGNDDLFQSAMGVFSITDEKERDAVLDSTTAAIKSRLTEIHRHKKSLLEEESNTKKRFASAKDKTTQDYLRSLEKEPNLHGWKKKLKETGAEFGKEAAKKFGEHFGEVTEDIKEDYDRMFKSVAKEAAKEYEDHMIESVGKVASVIKGTLNLVYNDLYKNYGAALLGTSSFGSIAISQNLKSGADMAYNFRKEYGNYGIGQTGIMADAITQAYKDMKREGITSDPTVHLKSLQSLRSMVSIGSLSQEKLAQLLSTTTKISESVLATDMSTPSMQYVLASFGTEMAEEFIGRMALASKSTEGVYTVDMANAMIANAEYVSQMQYLFGDKFVKVMEDQTQAFSLFGGLKGANASTLANLQAGFMDLQTGRYAKDAAYRLAGLGGGQLHLLDGRAMAMDPEAYLDTVRRASQSINATYLEDNFVGLSELKQSGLLDVGFSINDIQQIAKITDEEWNRYKSNVSGAMERDYSAGEAQAELARQTDKYTSIDKTNLDSMFQGWMHGTTYEDAVKEGFAKTLGYMDEFLPYVEKIYSVFKGGSGGSGGLLQGIVSGATGSAIVKAGLSVPKAGGLSNQLAASLGVTALVAAGVYAAADYSKKSAETTAAQLRVSDLKLDTIRDLLTPGGQSGQGGGTSASDLSGGKGFSTSVTQELDEKTGEYTSALTTEITDQSSIDSVIANSPATAYQSAYYSKSGMGFAYKDLYAGSFLGGKEDRLEVIGEFVTLGQNLCDDNPFYAMMFRDYIDSGLLESDNALLWFFYNVGRQGDNNTLPALTNTYKQGNLINLPKILSHVKNQSLPRLFYPGSFNFDPLGNSKQFGVGNYLQETPYVNRYNYSALNYYMSTQDGINTFYPMGSDGTIDLSNESEGIQEKFIGFATGLSNVPYNGMPAYLHQGEMVLPSGKANFIRALFGQKPVPGSGVPETQLTGNNSFVQSLPDYIQTGTISNGDGDSGVYGSFAAGDDAIAYARQYLGHFNYNRDRRKDPGYFDCSSLVARSYREGAGINVGVPTAAGIGEGFPGRGFGVLYQGGRLTKAQTMGMGLKAGDILLYDLNDTNNGRFMDIDHAAMAYNSSQQLHTSSPGKPVRIEDMWNKVVMVLRYGAGGEGLNPLYSMQYTSANSPAFRTYGGNGVGGGALAYLLGLYGLSNSGTGYSTGAATAGVSDSSGYLTNTYKSLLDKYAGIIGIDPRLLYGMMMTESSGRPNLNKGMSTKFKGLMQTTQDFVDQYVGIGSDIYDPENNIKAAAYYLQSAIKKTGYTSLGIGGYNAGPNLAAWQTARAILDSGGNWDTVLSKMKDVGGDRTAMSGNPDAIKTRYINSVYKYAGLPLQVPFLRDGGIISDPALVVAGEGPNPEAVTPLDEDQNLLGLMDMTNSIVDNLDSNTTRLIRKLEEIVSALNRKVDSVSLDYAQSRTKLRNLGTR